MDIEQAVDRLVGALRTAGAPTPAPGDQQAVAAVERLIAPLALPLQLRYFWTRLNPATVATAPWPDSSENLYDLEFAGLDFAWGAFRRQIDDPGLVPQALLSVSAIGDRFRFIELAGPSSQGGTVYAWSRGQAAFVPRFDSLSAWIASVADALEQGPVTKLGDGGMVFYDPGRLDDISPATGPPLVRWPDHWQEVSKLFDDRRQTNDADLSISELLWTGTGQRAEGTIAGVVEQLSWGDEGARVLVCDGTGVLDAWCAATTPGFAMLRSNRTFTLDVVAGPGLDDPRGDAVAWPDQFLVATPPQASVRELRPFLFR